MAPEPPGRTLQELRGRPSLLGRMDLGVGQAGVIVDADEDDLPACVVATLAAISVDPMTYCFATSQLLRVDMKQIARRRVFVALRRRLLLSEAPDAAHAPGLEMLRDRRDRNTELPRDLPARLAAPTELHPEAHGPTWRGSGLASGRAPPILEGLPAGLPEPSEPLAGGLPAHASGVGRPRDGPVPLENTTYQQKPRLRCQLRVRMELHPRSLFGGGGWSATPFPPKESQVSTSGSGPGPTRRAGPAAGRPSWPSRRASDRASSGSGSGCASP